MKVLKWIWDNSLFLITLLLLVFIPLYPKIPLLDVNHTWVYVRVEDFIVVFVLLLWVTLLIRRKISLKTPLTLPILLFWIAGGIATIHGVLLIFPGLANVFPNVAFLSFLRRVEYMSLFFIAFAGIKNKKFLPYIIAIITLTLFAVVAYGLGQKYLDFPAFLTMNEEFAKGTPIQLSSLSRIPSTFAGHYDLAAYLVLIVPILASLIFGFRNLFIKFILSLAVVSGIGLLFMTVSRVSFAVLLVSLIAVFFLHKKKLVAFSLPVIGVIFIFLFLNYSPRLLDRFDNTVKEVNVLVDTRTGEAVGHIKEIIPRSEYEDKLVKQKFFNNIEDINAKTIASEEPQEASNSAIVSYLELPASGVLLVPPNAPTGESLPQGTGYTNLALSPTKRALNEFFYANPNKNATESADVFMFTGKYIIKRAAAYDLSFTTRYQGEWPHAIEAFKRNIFFGSGYASISLAIDNSYLRMLGEVGVLGFIAFIAIFLVVGIYIKKLLPHVDSPVTRSFVIGYSVGVIGLALNALLIDVFEASKVAFYLWLLTGITLGLLHLYQTKQISFLHEFKKLASSKAAVIVLLGIFIFFLYYPMLNNYFIGDDFTWLRWAADCGNLLNSCPSIFERIYQYFTQSDGFFYRPGTKLYFLLMYSVFGLNPTMYHFISLIIHFIVVGLVFLLAKKILKDIKLSAFAAGVFVILSNYFESIFWIASTGHLVTSMFTLLGLYLFILWDERKNLLYFIGSMFSIVFGLLFQEAGIIAPFLILVYKFAIDGTFVKNLRNKKYYYIVLFSLIPMYLIVRLFAHSHWTGGDYSYNLILLPFNFVGNIVGYFMFFLFGPQALSIYEPLRNFSKTHLVIAVPAIILLACGIYFVYNKLQNTLMLADKKIVIFGILFVIVSALPFLGLGNITSRYTYLQSFGFVILFAFLTKKLYGYLESNGREIAIAGVTFLLSIFFLLQIIQMQQIQSDWFEAGKRVQNVFLSIERVFSNNWLTDSVDLYLVNVPTRTGEAWVFPVGLNDAVWFLFRNPNIHLHQDKSVEQALDIVGNNPNQKVLLFDEGGNAVEKKKLTPLR